MSVGELPDEGAEFNSASCSIMVCEGLVFGRGLVACVNLWMGIVVVAWFGIFCGGDCVRLVYRKVLSWNKTCLDM